jgi:hypothetical protein
MKPFQVTDTTRIRIEMMAPGRPASSRRRLAENALFGVSKRRAEVAAQLKSHQLNEHEAARLEFDTAALETAAKATLADLDSAVV